MTYCLGFRDDFEVKVRRLRTEIAVHLTRTHEFLKVDEVIRQICELEMNSNPGGYQKIVRRIKDAAQISTHMCVLVFFNFCPIVLFIYFCVFAECLTITS